MDWSIILAAVTAVAAVATVVFAALEHFRKNQ